MSMTPAEMREMAAKAADLYVIIFNHLSETTEALRESNETGRTAAARIAARIRAIPIPDTTGADDATQMRAAGWSVAVHNDYRVNGRSMTFWLWTHPNGQWIKGEGETDQDALVICVAAREALAAIDAAKGPSR